jgi:hypothetical protein
MCIRTAWDDYFPGTTPSKTLNQQKYNKVQSVSDQRIHVSNCLFNNCISGSNGGALSCSNTVICLLVESSSFFTCKTSSSLGGAIYFNNANGGQCVLYELCCFDCFSTLTGTGMSFGHFVYIAVGESTSNKNYVNYSSVSHCVNPVWNTRQTLSLQNGKICCPSINVSNNKIYRRTGINCYLLHDSLKRLSIFYTTTCVGLRYGFLCHKNV